MHRNPIVKFIYAFHFPLHLQFTAEIHLLKIVVDTSYKLFVPIKSSMYLCTKPKGYGILAKIS